MIRVGMGIGLGGQGSMAAVVAPPPTSYSDTFDRANSLTTLSSPWTAVQGTWGISANEAYCVSDTHNDRAVVPGVGSANYVVKCNIKGSIIDDANASRPCLLIRYLDNPNFITAHLIGDSLAIQKSEGGTVSTLASVIVNPLNDTYYELKAECSGGTIKIYLDGVLTVTHNLSAGDQTLFGATQQVGIRLRRSGVPSSQAKWNNFSVTAL